MANLNGRPMYVFALYVPARSGYSILADSGHTYAAASGYAVIQLKLDYKLTAVGGQQFALPSHFDIFARHEAGETSSMADYKL